MSTTESEDRFYAPIAESSSGVGRGRGRGRVVLPPSQTSVAASTVSKVKASIKKTQDDARRVQAPSPAAVVKTGRPRAPIPFCVRETDSPWPSDPEDAQPTDVPIDLDTPLHSPCPTISAFPLPPSQRTVTPPARSPPALALQIGDRLPSSGSDAESAVDDSPRRHVRRQHLARCVPLQHGMLRESRSSDLLSRLSLYSELDDSPISPVAAPLSPFALASAAPIASRISVEGTAKRHVAKANSLSTVGVKLRPTKPLVIVRAQPWSQPAQPGDAKSSTPLHFPVLESPVTRTDLPNDRAPSIHGSRRRAASGPGSGAGVLPADTARQDAEAEAIEFVSEQMAGWRIGGESMSEREFLKEARRSTSVAIPETPTDRVFPRMDSTQSLRATRSMRSLAAQPRTPLQICETCSFELDSGECILAHPRSYSSYFSVHTSRARAGSIASTSRTRNTLDQLNRDLFLGSPSSSFSSSSKSASSSISSRSSTLPQGPNNTPVVSRTSTMRGSPTGDRHARTHSSVSSTMLFSSDPLDGPNVRLPLPPPDESGYSYEYDYSPGSMSSSFVSSELPSPADTDWESSVRTPDDSMRAEWRREMEALRRGLTASMHQMGLDLRSDIDRENAIMILPDLSEVSFEREADEVPELPPKPKPAPRRTTRTPLPSAAADASLPPASADAQERPLPERPKSRWSEDSVRHPVPTRPRSRTHDVRPPPPLPPPHIATRARSSTVAAGARDASASPPPSESPSSSTPTSAAKPGGFSSVAKRLRLKSLPSSKFASSVAAKIRTKYSATDLRSQWTE